MLKFFEWDFVGYMALIGLMIGVIIGIIIAAWVDNDREKQLQQEHTTYFEVIVDDSVTLNEFMDHYEIVDTKGKILIVREIK